MKVSPSGSKSRIAVLLVLAFVFALGAPIGTGHVSVAKAAAADLGLTLPQGWNLIADPGGIIPSGPAYTLQQTDTTYEIVTAGTPLVPGLGYWVQAQSRSGLPLPAGQLRATIQAPASRFVMIGDPSGVLTARVSGADLILAYDPVQGYSVVTDNTLQPGQGAFAFSRSGGTITLVAEGTTAATCSTSDTGSACPVNGSCPQGFPVAITNDTLAHPPVQAGEPAVQGPIVLCFNDLSQATAAGYQPAPPSRLVLTGPATAITDGIQVTVLRATLETPAAFIAHAQAAGEGVLASFNPSTATAVLTVDYQLENINRPVTAFGLGVFQSDHYPNETVPGVMLLANEQPLLVHQGVPVSGSVSAVFTTTKFSDIGEVDWLLQQVLTDSVSTSPHGTSIEFELHFAGPLAGQIVALGGDSGTP